jgi:hypothetical protein
MTRNFRRSMPARKPLVCGDGLAGRLPGSPLRVNRVILTAGRSLPVYPYKQTSLPCVGMSQMCRVEV